VGEVGKFLPCSKPPKTPSWSVRIPQSG
jgi:hypothetical protein